MTPDGLLCAACLRPFAGRLARATDDGYRHVLCPSIPPRPQMLPFAPLEPYMGRVNNWPERDALRLAVKKARTRGRVTIRTADRAAIRLGLHPALIWGDAWWVPVEESAA